MAANLEFGGERRRCLRHLWRRGTWLLALLVGEAAADHARDLLAQLLARFQRAKPCDGAGRVEIPVVVGEADEIPNTRIG